MEVTKIEIKKEYGDVWELERLSEIERRYA